ncbi:MAG: cytochrome c, partial [Planctomycetota bacterium]
ELAGATADGALRTALLRGACDVLPKGNGRVGWYELPAVPPALVALLAGSDPVVAALAQELVGAIAITGTTAPATVADLTPEERTLATAGETTFRRACAACHQLDGNGMQGLAPPLRDSEWVTGPAERLVRIALHGVKGPIDVNGATWSLEMPGQRHLGDQDLAGVLTWLRRAFGHRQGAVSIGAVAAERRAQAQRSEPWTATELLGGK